MWATPGATQNCLLAISESGSVHLHFRTVLLGFRSYLREEHRSVPGRTGGFPGPRPPIHAYGCLSAYFPVFEIGMWWFPGHRACTQWHCFTPQSLEYLVFLKWHCTFCQLATVHYWNVDTLLIGADLVYFGQTHLSSSF